MDIEQALEWIGKYWMLLFLLFLNIIVCLYALANIQTEVNKHDAYYIKLLNDYCPQALSIGMKLQPPPFNITSMNIS